MKKCPSCAEDVQDAAVKCRHCGESLPTQAARTRSSLGLSYFPLFVLLNLIAIAIWVFAAYLAYTNTGLGAALKVLVVLIPCLVLSPIAWNLADAFRSVATPQAFLARGMVDIFIKKLGFTFGPFVVAVALVYVGAFVLVSHLGWIDLGLSRNNTASERSLSQHDARARTAPTASESETKPIEIPNGARRSTAASAAPDRQLRSASFAPKTNSTVGNTQAVSPSEAVTHAYATVAFSRQQADSPECELGFSDADGTTNANGIVWTLPSGEKIYMGKSCDLASQKYGNGIWGWSNETFRLQFGTCHLSSPEHSESPLGSPDCEINIANMGNAITLTASKSAVKQNLASPSFDCNAAQLPTETQICRVSVLADADATISGMYARALTSQATTKREQIDWLNRRNACLAETGCIARSEAERIHQLHIEIQNSL